MTAKNIQKWKQDMKIFILQHASTVVVLGERGQPAASEGNNHLLVLAFHSKCNEELKRLVI